MTRSRPLDKPVRSAFSTWLSPGCLLLIYVGSSLQPILLRGDWRGAVTFALAGLGFVVTMLVRGSAPRHRHTAADAHRLDVLTYQSLAVYVMAGIVDWIWRAQVVQVPVVVSLAAIVTAMMAAEAVVIRRRGLKPRPI